jgi:hypothetical protein
MKLRATWTIDYDLPPNLKERAADYDTIDPIECAEVDQYNNPVTLFESVTCWTENVNIKMTVESVLRVMVSGSRDWASYGIVRTAFDDIEVQAHQMHAQKIQLVHGGARGLDTIAGDHAITRAHEGGPWLPPEVHQADWRPDGHYDNAAGFKRNTQMAESGIDYAAVFLMDCTKKACKVDKPHITHGTSQALDELERLDIPLRKYRQLCK